MLGYKRLGLCEGSTAYVKTGHPRHRTRPGSSVPHPGIGMLSQQHHPGRLSRLCQTRFVGPDLLDTQKPNMLPTGTQGHPNRGDGPHENLRSFSVGAQRLGTAGCSRGKSHLRHADKISPTQELIRRNGKGGRLTKQSSKNRGGGSAKGPPGGDRQRLLGKGGVVTETSLAVTVSNPRPMERSILHAVMPSWLVFIVIPDVNPFPPFSCKLLQRDLVHLAPNLLLHGLDLLLRIDLIGLCKVEHQPTPQKMGVL